MVKFRFFDPDEEKPRHHRFEHKSTFQSEAPSSGLTLNWIRELHWRENPFTIKADPAHVFLVNQDAARQAINLFFIKEQRFGTIAGDEGSGKTFFMHWVREELAAYKDRFYVHQFDASNTTVAAFTEQIAKPFEKLFRSYKGSTPQEFVTFLEDKLKGKQRFVLLFDNAGTLGDLEPYVSLMLAKLPTAVILAAVRPQVIATDELIVKLKPLEAADAAKLLEKRITSVGGTGYKPFTQQLINELWTAAKKNPVTFLNYCNETAMKIALKQIRIDEETPEEFLLKKDVAPKGKEPKKAAAKSNKSQYDDLIASFGK